MAPGMGTERPLWVTIIVGVVFMAVWGISVRLRIGVDAASA